MLKLSELREKYNSEEACLLYLSELKWPNGYKCPKCGCKHYYKGRKYYFRKCQNCDFDESPTAGTLFHKLKFSMVTAFEIIYWITQTKKGMSIVDIANHFGINQKSAWRFKRKVQIAMSGAKRNKLSGNVEIDEFMLGSLERWLKGGALEKSIKLW